MQDIQTPFLTHVALVFNALGHGIWRALTLAGIGLVLLLARRWAALAAFAVAEALTPLFSNLIKLAVGRERPPGHMLEAHGTSFPLGTRRLRGRDRGRARPPLQQARSEAPTLVHGRSRHDRRDGLEPHLSPGALAVGRARRSGPGRCRRLAQLRGRTADPRAPCRQALLNQDASSSSIVPGPPGSPGVHPKRRRSRVEVFAGIAEANRCALHVKESAGQVGSTSGATRGCAGQIDDRFSPTPAVVHIGITQAPRCAHCRRDDVEFVRWHHPITTTETSSSNPDPSPSTALRRTCQACEVAVRLLSSFSDEHFASEALVWRLLLCNGGSRTAFLV